MMFTRVVGDRLTPATGLALSAGLRSGLLVLGLAALLAPLLSGCAADKPPPTPLDVVAPRIAGKQVWTASVGVPLQAGTVALVRQALGDRFVVASQGGVISVLDVATGAVRERIDVGAALSAGVGSDGRFHAVVTQDNELLVIDAGKVRWRARIGSRVVSAPLVAGERVFLQGVDRVVEAYDALDGRKLWSLARPGESLALAQRGVMLAYKDTLLVGIGPRLLGVDPLLGTVRSETIVAAPRGTNEVERLADLVGPAARVNDAVCTRAFQATVACVNAERNTLVWQRNFGGYEGVAADADYVFAADSSDRIGAWKRASGDPLWTSEKLRFRSLSAPVLAGTTVVFGDAEGFLHFLSRDKGEQLLRLPTDGSAIAVPLVRSGQTLLALTRKGTAHAFRPE
jgi:outer membrane assembly lipoprotein YfgL